MGSGGSRLNAENEAIPARVRPMLRRRIEEIGRRKSPHGGKDKTTPPGTELLLSHDGKARNNEDEIRNGMAEAGDPQREEREKEKNKEGEKVKAAKGSQNNGREEDGNGSHDNEEDDEGLHGDEDSILYPGSPSFRIYFMDKLDEDEEDEDVKDDGRKDDGENEKTDRDHGMPPEKDLQDSDSKKLKKGRRKSSFRKVMPKGGQNAMKNLFNVRSCYTPSCSSHDRAHLLTEKTPA